MASTEVNLLGLSRNLLSAAGCLRVIFGGKEHSTREMGRSLVLYGFGTLHSYERQVQASARAARSVCARFSALNDPTIPAFNSWRSFQEIIYIIASVRSKPDLCNIARNSLHPSSYNSDSIWTCWVVHSALWPLQILGTCNRSGRKRGEDGGWWSSVKEKCPIGLCPTWSFIWYILYELVQKCQKCAHGRHLPYNKICIDWSMSKG